MTFAAQAGADSYDVAGEVSSRVVLNGGAVVGLRRRQMAGGRPAAILRYRAQS